MKKSEYILEGKSEYDFNDRSTERMDKLNAQLKERITLVRRMVAKKGRKTGS